MGDASFKVGELSLPEGIAVTHFSKIEQIMKHTAKDRLSSCYTAMNEFNEIRMQVLTLSKSLDHLRDPLLLLQQSLANRGHRPVGLLFIDNVEAEASFFERTIPSLRRDVRHIPPPTVDGLPQAKLPEGYNCIYIDHFEEIERACKNIRIAWERRDAKNGADADLLCGFDTEHTVHMVQGGSRSPTDVIQFAFESEGFIFQVCTERASGSGGRADTASLGDWFESTSALARLINPGSSRNQTRGEHPN